MIELNLLPDVKKEFIKAQRTRNTVISLATIVTIGAGILTTLLVSYVYVAQPLYIGSQTSSIKKNEQALKDIPQIDKYLTVQNQLNSIDTLHNERYVYSRAFSYLQQLNPAAPNNVALSSVVFSKETNSLEIEGVAGNFQAMNVFKNTLENASLTYTVDGTESSVALFDEVVLQEAGLANIENVRLANFKMLLTYPDVAFLNTSTNVKISVPAMVTSDADRNAPVDIFGTPPEGMSE